MSNLRTYLLISLSSFALVAAAWSQDRDDNTAAEVPEPDEAAAAAAPESAEDEGAIDDESYVDIEEEDFRPSEEIDADQSIPFPVDI